MSGKKTAEPKTGDTMSIARRLELQKGLNAKEAIVLDGLVKGKRAPAAVQAAGYQLAGSQAHALAEGIRRKYTDANGYLLVALEGKGVTFDTVADTLKDGLSATFAMKKKDDCGDTVVDHIPDYNIRHKYLETTLDVMGAKAPKKQVTETVTSHEETIGLVEGMRDNPEVIAALRRRLEMRQKTIQTTSNQVEEKSDEEA